MFGSYNKAIEIVDTLISSYSKSKILDPQDIEKYTDVLKQLKRVLVKVEDTERKIMEAEHESNRGFNWEDYEGLH